MEQKKLILRRDTDLTKISVFLLHYLVTVIERLKLSLRKFYGQYGILSNNMNSPSQMLKDIQEHDHTQFHPSIDQTFNSWSCYRTRRRCSRIWPFNRIFRGFQITLVSFKPDMFLNFELRKYLFTSGRREREGSIYYFRTKTKGQMKRVSSFFRNDKTKLRKSPNQPPYRRDPIPIKSTSEHCRLQIAEYLHNNNIDLLHAQCTTDR